MTVWISGMSMREWRSDPLAGIGQFCGIEQIDSAIRGAKKQELWLHAAFTGGLKSTFAMNWAYNQAVYYKFSMFLLSRNAVQTMWRRSCMRCLLVMKSLIKVRPKGKDDVVTVQKIQFGELSKKAQVYEGICSTRFQ